MNWLPCESGAKTGCTFLPLKRIMLVCFQKFVVWNKERYINGSLDKTRLYS
jgi:hypothetical protein